MPIQLGAMMVVMIADLGREFTVRLLHVDSTDKVVLVFVRVITLG